MRYVPRSTKRWTNFWPISSSEVETGEIVKDRGVEQQTVEPIKQAAVAGENGRGVFCAGAAFYCAFGQVPEDTDNSHHSGERDREFEGQFGKEQPGAECGRRNCADDASRQTFPRFPR